MNFYLKVEFSAILNNNIMSYLQLETYLYSHLKQTFLEIMSQVLQLFIKDKTTLDCTLFLTWTDDIFCTLDTYTKDFKSEIGNYKLNGPFSLFYMKFALSKFKWFYESFAHKCKNFLLFKIIFFWHGFNLWIIFKIP